MSKQNTEHRVQTTGKAILCLCLAAALGADDWPHWGRDNSRNMVSTEKNLPDSWTAGDKKAGSEEIDVATAKNVRWVAKLGSQTYGNPTVSGGRVFVGTNNESPRDPRFKGDRCVVMCFDEKSGELLWQLAIPKLGTGKVSDWEFLGICSSPAVDGDRVYVLSNRGEVLCLDVHGMANGNDGPYMDEGSYLAKPPATPGPKDGDIIWRFDIIGELGVFPHNITGGSVLIVGDKLFTTTSNGVDWSHVTIPNPRAPALCVLDKRTGKYMGEEVSGISARTLHGNWSSPTYGKIGNQEMVFFGAGDGWCYAYDPEPLPERDQIRDLKELWRFDCNPPHYRMRDGKPIKYAVAAKKEGAKTWGDGPNDVMATPVFYKDRVYVATGQDPEHGEGHGNLVCIDAASGKQVWANDTVRRTMATVAISDGLLFIGDYSGYIHCIDAETGKTHWTHDTKHHIWGSPLVADGKVYIGNEDGNVFIFAVDKSLKLIGTIPMGPPVYSSPVAANGTLYVATNTHLYAIAKK